MKIPDITKNCTHCGEAFAATCGVAKFCSDRCHLLSGGDRAGECLIWRHGKDKDGYGLIKLRGGRRVKVHRAAYETFIGPVPIGQEVCHSCDMPACFEPAHLFAGTTQENKNDCIAKDRHVRGERVYWKAKLTEAQVLEIKRDPRTSPPVAADYGVSAVTVQMIRAGKTWKHLL